MEGQADTITPARAADRPEAVARAQPDREGAEDARRAARSACWSPTAPMPALVDALRAAVEKAGAATAGGRAENRRRQRQGRASASPPITPLAGGAVDLLRRRGRRRLPPKARPMLEREAAAIDWVRDAFGHLKVIGHTAGAAPLLERAGVEPDAGVVALG